MNQEPLANDSKKPNIAGGLTLLLAVVAGTLRFIPHPAGISAVGSLGMFGGGRLKSWQAYLIPLLLLVVTDLGLTYVSGQMMYAPWNLTRLYVYPSFMVYVLIGRWLESRRSLAALATAGLAGSIQFFLLTNFFEWLFQPWRQDEVMWLQYSRDWAGLMQCYLAALPFFEGELLTDPFGFIFGHPSYGVYGTLLSDCFFTILVYKLHDAIADAPTEPNELPALNSEPISNAAI